MNPPISKPQFLTIEEKRASLAHVFRDTSGYYTDADKFKALQADTELALILENQQTKPRKRNKKMNSKEKSDTCRDCLTCKHIVKRVYDELCYGPGIGLCRSWGTLVFTAMKCERYEADAMLLEQAAQEAEKRAWLGEMFCDSSSSK